MIRAGVAIGPPATFAALSPKVCRWFCGLWARRVRPIEVNHYRYDGLGRRVQAWSPTINNSNILSQYSQAGQLMYQRNGRSGLAYDYVYLNGSLVAIREQPLGGGATTNKYQHTDALGSPVGVTDQNRVVIEKNEYEPCGKVINHPLKDGPGYTGHVADAATGLMNMQQRYFDPYLCRFVSVDPMPAYSPRGTFNRYWYANASPYKFFDPDGRYVCSGSKENCDNFKAGLALVDKASNSTRLNAEQRGVLKAVVGFYGKEGDDSVRVSFTGKGLVQGTATLGKDGKADIGLVPGKSVLEHGRDILHEGSHGLDDKNRGRVINSLAERKATEVKAYTAQAHFQNAENFAASSRDGWTPWGGYSEENIDAQADRSIRISCGQTTSGSCGP